MKILVTGGAGFIASHIVDRYIKDGHQVIIVDDLSTGKKENINVKAVFYHMSITDPSLFEVFKTEKPQVINHHAAQMNVRRSIVDPLFDATINVIGSLKLIEMARGFGVEKFIYASSGGAQYGEPQYLPVDEDHPVLPLSQYGVSKHTVSHYLYLYGQNYNLPYVILEYPNVYGPRQDPLGEAGVVAIFLGRMLRNEDVIINGDGEQERDFVYIDDIVEANALALDSKESGRYTVGSERGTSVNAIFRELVQQTQYGRNPIYGPPLVGEVYKVYLSQQRIQAALGWKPRIGLVEGLAKTSQYFRSYRQPSEV